MSTRKTTRANFIHDVQVTNDCLTSRAGLNPFVRSLRGVDLFPHLHRLFGSMRKHPKGAPVDELLKQVLYFLFDGTSRHLAYFDTLAKDPCDAAVIETAPEDMASSHTIKRFYQAFSPQRIYLFPRLFQQLFHWRLAIATPSVIELNIDTMVMENDQAPKRHGVKPTYKKVLGFQPLQMTWGRYIIDAVFRGGDKHSKQRRHRKADDPPRRAHDPHSIQRDHAHHHPHGLRLLRPGPLCRDGAAPPSTPTTSAGRTNWYTGPSREVVPVVWTVQRRS